MELKIPPVLQVILIALIMLIITQLTPPLQYALPYKTILSSSIAITGLIIIGISAYQFHRAQTTLSPLSPQSSNHLITHGLYQYSRNPIYLGFLLLLASWAIFLESLSASIGLPLFILWINRYQIIPEERYLTERFGGVYEQYCQKTRRWI